MTAPGHHPGGKKINCCSEERQAGRASKDVDAHEVRVIKMTKGDDKGRGSQIRAQGEGTKEQARKGMFVKLPHGPDHTLAAPAYYLI